MQYYQVCGMCDVIVEDIYIGNGVLEFIVQVMQVLLNSGDEMLVFVLDYLLWIVVVLFFSGKVVYYFCDEFFDWFLDFDDICVKIMFCMCGIVIINLNNLIGVVYFKEFLMEIVEIVCQYNFIIFVDEIYDKIFYDDVEYYLIVLLVFDLLIIIFNGLLKMYCVVGFCQGWMVLNGLKKYVKGYIEGLEMLVLMCLCVNVFV